MSMFHRRHHGITYTLKAPDWGFEAFHTFCQTLKEDDGADDGVPNKSILRSPFMSIGIGCAKEEEVASIGPSEEMLEHDIKSCR